MASIVSICNKALYYLGQDDIRALTDDQKSARLCAQFYPELRDEVLCEHAWNFATRYTALAYKGEAASAAQAFGWQYAYQLPADCLQVRRLEGDAPYAVQEGGVLLTNQADANAVLTVRVSNAAQFPALFVEALARKLAAELAVPLTASSKLEQSMVTKFLNALDRARVADASEGEEEEADGNSWTRARL